MYKATSLSQQRRTHTGNFAHLSESSPHNENPGTVLRPRDELEFRRADLIAEKGRVDQRSAYLRDKIRTAKEHSQRTGRWTGATQFSDWHKELAGCQQRSQGLQAEISKLKVTSRQMRNNSFEQNFIAVCREMLADEIFDRLYRIASDRADLQ